MLVSAPRLPSHPSSSPAQARVGQTSLIVLGMHRSGTSAFAGVLHHLGLSLGTNLMEATPENPKGFFESLPIVKLNDRILGTIGRAWNAPQAPDLQAARTFLPEICRTLVAEFGSRPIWALKDPRMCRLLPLYLQALDQLGVRVIPVLVLRQPSEVVLSLEKRDGLGISAAYTLWIKHIAEAVQYTHGEVIAIQYEDLLQRWKETLAPLLAILPGGIDIGASETAAVEAFLDRSLQHHRGEFLAENEDQLLHWMIAHQLYRTLRDDAPAVRVRAAGDALEALAQLEQQRQRAAALREDRYERTLKRALDEIEFLRGVIDSAHAWQRGSWWRRAFHRWRGPKRVRTSG